MRIGAFLLGSIAGATAVIYFNRKSKSLLFSAFSSTNNSVNKIVENAKDTLSGKAAKLSPAFHNSASANNLNKVEKWVNEDPALKQSVNEILGENKQKAQTLQ